MDAHDPRQFALMPQRIAEVQTFIDLTGVRVREQWDALQFGKKEK